MECSGNAELNVNSAIILEDVRDILSADLPWKSLENKHIVITGANGMLPAYLVETILALPFPLKLSACVRNMEKAKKRFARHLDDGRLVFRELGLNCPVPEDFPPCHILVHAASIPRPDTNCPADVLQPNLIGTWNLLEYARRCPEFEQFLLFSSAAVYGENSTAPNSISETFAGTFDPLDLHSCYALGKIAAEASSAAFRKQYGIPCKVLRYSHTYGPGLDLQNDPRSMASFLSNVLKGEDISLISSGEAVRYFCYIADATSAFFHVLFNGMDGEAYNVAAPENGISLLSLAKLLVSFVPERNLSVKVCQKALTPGFSPLTFAACPNIDKLNHLGFSPKYSVQNGFRRTFHAYNTKP